MDFTHDKSTLERQWFAGRVAPNWVDEHSYVLDGRLLLGGATRLGFGSAFVVHEMAHLVEIDDRRATLQDFGLRYKRIIRLPPTRYSSGIYEEPLTSQGVERECRVIAIGDRILEAIGWAETERREDAERTIYALRHMADWCNIPRKGENARREWCQQKVAKALPLWPIERVRAEWWRKVVLVTKRLESAQRRARTGEQPP